MNEIIDQPSTNPPEPEKRPLLITIVCILGFIGSPFAFFMVFSEASRMVGNWYPPYLAFSALVGLVCMIGLWNMKRWAVYTYTGLTALTQLVLFTMGVWSPFSLILPAIVIVLIFTQLDKMR